MKYTAFYSAFPLWSLKPDLRLRFMLPSIIIINKQNWLKSTNHVTGTCPFEPSEISRSWEVRNMIDRGGKRISHDAPWTPQFTCFERRSNLVCAYRATTLWHNWLDSSQHMRQLWFVYKCYLLQGLRKKRKLLSFKLSMTNTKLECYLRESSLIVHELIFVFQRLHQKILILMEGNRECWLRISTH